MGGGPMGGRNAVGVLAIYLLGMCLMLHAERGWATRAKPEGWCTTTMPQALPSTIPQNSIAIPRDLPVGAVIPGTHLNIFMTMTCKAGAFNTGTNTVKADLFSLISF